MLNSVSIIGFVNQDIELKTTPSNTTFCSFIISNIDGYGEKQKTFRFSVVCWRKLAEIVAKFCHKGSLVAVSGQLQSKEFEKDGVKKTIVEIVANDVQFLDTKKEKEAPAQVMDEEYFV